MRKAIGAVLYHCSEATNSGVRCEKTKSSVFHSLINVAYQLPFVTTLCLFFRIYLHLNCLKSASMVKPRTVMSHSMVSYGISKDIFVGSNVLKMGVCSAVLAFNSGIIAMLRIYQKLEMKRGFYTTEFCVKKDGKRIEKMGKKMSVEGKSNRQRKRVIK